jgi:tetratricopeptide (TPR) repeat protein
MALRLTTTPLATEEGDQRPTDPGAWVVGLASRAGACLVAEDLDTYRDLLRQAGEHEQPDRRYQAQVALLEQGLSAAGHAPAGPAARIFAAVAVAALDLLEQSPSEPVVLNYAGVAAYELWALEAAKALFTAARRLDPELANVERNLAEVARRARGQRPRKPIGPVAVTLGRRARAIARRARAATGRTLSLCMIVRDEERMLGRCLAAAAPAVDEIIIVDTGSQDATIEIARSFGARVIERPWTGSFADARNASFEAATGDWLMYLDADEVLVADDVPRLRALTGHTWREAFSLVETSFTGELGDGAELTHTTLRMFRNRPEYRFDGRIHEQIADKLPSYAPGRIGHTPVRIEHYGYLESVRSAKEKFQRNIELLRAQAAENDSDPFLHFNLGCEYAAAGDARSAVAELERSWSLLQGGGAVTSREWTPTLILVLVKNLRFSGRPHDALRWAQDGLELFPQLTDLVLEQGTAWQDLGDETRAEALYRRCLELGDAPTGHGSIVGSGTFRPRLALAKLLLARGETAEARELLQFSLEHDPDFLPAVAPYATARLAQGDDPAEVVDAIERLLDTVPAAVRHVLARTLRGARAGASAERQYRMLIDDEPANGSARVALAELLLGRAAYSEAAAEAAAVGADDPFASLACRLELCGLIGADDPAAARAALVRAAGAGLPAVEHQVFEAWAAISEGTPAPDGVPAAGVPLLGTIMELLLGAGDLARFEALLPALQGAQLADREKRELLADMYLKHGHLVPAAKQWMAVCSGAPDARALLGLARVAVAQGMPSDAATFATGALELDPGSIPARQLLDRLPAPAALDG